METRKEPDGSLVLTYDSTGLTKWMAGVVAVLLLTALYDVFIGSRGTERLIGLFAGAATCSLTALVFFERSYFRFDSARKSIDWSRRWGLRRRFGTVSFHDVRRVVVEVPIGDQGIPSRRICLRLANDSLIPLTVSYRPDVFDKIEEAAADVRAILGHDTAPTPAARAQGLVEDGNRIAAIRLLVEEEGLSLTDAKQRVDAIARSLTVV